MPMPFSPCSATPCPDVTVGILTKVFGPIVTSLVDGTAPGAAAATHLLANTIGFYNSGLLVVASLIVTYVAVMGAVNTANDGEAMGRSWSAFATPLRIVAGGAVLLPSASGYSFIQMLVLMISLWSVGFANGVYKLGMTVGIMNPKESVSTVSVPGTYYGMRQFAKDYIAVKYCALSANELYNDPMGKPQVGPGKNGTGLPDMKTKEGSKESEVYNYQDRNPVTNLAGGDPLCGTVHFSRYLTGNTYPDDPSGTHLELDRLRVKLFEVKLTATANMIKQLDLFVAKWPIANAPQNWSLVTAKEFNGIIRTHEDQVAAGIMAKMGDAKGGVDTGAEAFFVSLTKEGWSMAGGFYQRVGMMRTRMAHLTSEPVAKATAPSMSGLPDDSRAKQLRSSVQTAVSAFVTSAEETDTDYEPTKTINPEDVASFLPKDTDSDFNVTAIHENIGSKISLIINNWMKSITDTAIGSGGNEDAVTRMKMTGDQIASFRMGLWVAKGLLLNTATGVRLLAGLANSVKVVGTGVDGTGMTTPLWDWILAVPVKILDDMAEYASILAFYFGVLLPSLPYTIFMITVVGWILAVFQSVIAAPLWAIMHMRPSQTFVGSDSQGYLLLLSLFVRPALAVMGLFAAMLIADPVVDYIAKAFFAMRGDVVASTDLWGALASFYSFFWWFSVFGTVLLPVLYMIYGLPQVLPDAVLKWLGAGLDDMGSGKAIGGMQGGASGAMAAGTAGKISKSSGQTQGMIDRAKARSEGGGGKAGGGDGGGGGAGNKPLNANPQGAVDSGATQSPPSYRQKELTYGGDVKASPMGNYGQRAQNPAGGTGIPTASKGNAGDAGKGSGAGAGAGTAAAAVAVAAVATPAAAAAGSPAAGAPGGNNNAGSTPMAGNSNPAGSASAAEAAEAGGGGAAGSADASSDGALAQSAPPAAADDGGGSRTV